jgi:hypothetical protein
MKRIFFFTLFSLGLVTTICNAEESSTVEYLCIGDSATGFAMDQKTKSWSTKSFRGRKYVVKAPVKGENAPSGAYNSVMAVYQTGAAGPADALAFCDKDFNSVGTLFCEGLGDTFHLNRQSLRFIRYFPFGYIETYKDSFFGPEGSATPFMEIGKCEQI